MSEPVADRYPAAVRAEAVNLLNAVLDLVDTGALDASSAHGIRLVRRVEGAVTALEATYDRDVGI